MYQNGGCLQFISKSSESDSEEWGPREAENIVEYFLQYFKNIVKITLL